MGVTSIAGIKQRYTIFFFLSLLKTPKKYMLGAAGLVTLVSVALGQENYKWWEEVVHTKSIQTYKEKSY